MSSEKLQLLLKEIAGKSLSKTELVLSYGEAIDALNICEKESVMILGWEGWVKSQDGRIGHTAEVQNGFVGGIIPWCSSRFCRQTINGT